MRKISIKMVAISTLAAIGSLVFLGSSANAQLVEVTTTTTGNTTSTTESTSTTADTTSTTESTSTTADVTTTTTADTTTSTTLIEVTTTQCEVTNGTLSGPCGGGNGETTIPPTTAEGTTIPPTTAPGSTGTTIPPTTTPLTLPLAETTTTNDFDNFTTVDIPESTEAPTTTTNVVEETVTTVVETSTTLAAAANDFDTTTGITLPLVTNESFRDASGDNDVASANDSFLDFDTDALNGGIDFDTDEFNDFDNVDSRNSAQVGVDGELAKTGLETQHMAALSAILLALGASARKLSKVLA